MPVPVLALGAPSPSIIDKRLFVQLKALKNKFMSPIVILEGQGVFGQRQIEPSAIWGAIAAILADFNIPIITTRDPKETAQLLLTIARREFKEGGGQIRTGLSQDIGEEQKASHRCLSCTSGFER